MPAPPLVELRELSHRYRASDSTLVIDRVSLNARRGEFISLIGPSGCGKSTLLRLIAGLLPVASGTLQLAPLTEVGFVFQDPTLLPWLTVEANVALPIELRGRATAEASALVAAEARALIANERRAPPPPSGEPPPVGTHIKKLLNLVRLSERARAYPHELSGGQKMRVSIARALTLAPQLLLLDEPFGALDEMTREHLQEELLALHAEQKWCGLFVTHSVAEAVFLSDRVFIMSAAPGRFVHEVAIKLPRERDADTRLSPAYQAQVAEVSRLLRNAENARAS